MGHNLFVGRSQELKDLQRYLKKRSTSLIVIKGRRRVGKSRLVEEFACDLNFYSFAGLLPDKKVIDQDQRNEFTRLVLPRGFSCCPVLIHVNGVEDRVLDSDYFTEIIDFSRYLE